jgi:phosphoadenosine phosphosulfate reductase
MTNDSPIDLENANRTLEPLSAKERILWAAKTFSEDLVLLSSMQRSGVVLMHLFHELGLGNEVLFLDTGYHFFETLRMRDEYIRRYRLNIVTLYPELTTEDQESKHGKKLFTCTDGQPECCRLRKEAPLLKHLAAKRLPAVANGLRRAEGGMRARIKILGPDLRTGGFQLSPICDWSDDDLRGYVEKHALPLHPLYEKGFASIGCYPCTTPIGPGESPRAGRWRHLRPPEAEESVQYCGINFSDGAGI